MKTNYVTIIINPVAGNGKAGKEAQVILEKIKNQSDFEINIAFTGGKNEAEKITRKAINEGSSMVIAVGGDGTINEVVNGFFAGGKPINPLCELGVIDCGTGGGYARTLKCPRRISEQIDLLVNSESKALDLGQISYRGPSGKTVSRLFANECQAGIGCNVASSVGKKSKIIGGTLAFGIAATLFAFSMKAIKLVVVFDNEAPVELSLIGLVVGNGTECAGGMKLTPDARLNDGFFDVLSIGEMSITQRILNLSKVYSGKHILSPYFSVRRCKKLKIESETELSLESDGEIIGNSPYNIELIPAAIKVRAANINI